jgi:hypothetical protein
MKVAINKCYGGFQMSLEAQEYYLSLLGKKAYFYKQTKYKHNGGYDEFIKVDKNHDNLFVHTLLIDLGDKFENIPNDHDIWFFESDLDRSDLNLISTIEFLGIKASGKCSELTIVEIPDGVEYEISDYDGMESIHESHRSWA